MGITQSTVSAGDTGGRSSDNAAADSYTASNYGFSKDEAHRLSTLQRLVSQEQNKSENNDFLALLWRCSNLHALNAPSPCNNASDIEAYLRQHSPSQLATVQKRCQQLDILLSTYPSLKKINDALEKIFMNSDHFLEKASNILGMQGQYQKDSLAFVWDICCNNNGDSSIPAKDILELCFQMASAFQCVLQEHAFDGTKLVETRNIPGEDDMVQSMANSLLEYGKSSRNNNQYFGGYSDPGATTDKSAATIAEGSVSEREFSEWQRKVVPDLINCSVEKFHQIIFFPPGHSQQHIQNIFPVVKSSREMISQTTSKAKEGELIPILSHLFGKNTRSAANCTPTTLLSPPVFAFSSISMSKFGQKWYRIFSGETDGWTFQSLEHSILGYEGPTLLVIQGHHSNSKNETVTLGAYSASKWEKNKKDFFGSSDCFLYQLQPVMRVLRPLPKMGTRGGHYMYFHSNTNVNTSNPGRKDDMALGLGFGGTVRHPRLFIDDHLEQCNISNQDTSFEEGYLGLPPSNDPFSSQNSSASLQIDSLEFYAVGNEDTIRKGFKAQCLHRDITDTALRNARTVDTAAFLDDMRSGVIETKAFAHRGQVDGRAHGCMKGEEDEKSSGF